MPTAHFIGLTAASPVDLMAQDADGIIPNQPDDNASLLVFLVVGVALVGVYWLIRRSRRRSEDAYWDRKAREEDLRRNDPDMARPSDSDPPSAESNSDEG